MTNYARWGVAEWIERPLLMLEVRGRTPATPLQKIPLLYPETLEVQLRILELGDEAGEKQKKNLRPEKLLEKWI